MTVPKRYTVTLTDDQWAEIEGVLADSRHLHLRELAQVIRLRGVNNSVTGELDAVVAHIGAQIEALPTSKNGYFHHDEAVEYDVLRDLLEFIKRGDHIDPPRPL